jgi:hypothetical protein
MDNVLHRKSLPSGSGPVFPFQIPNYCSLLLKIPSVGGVARRWSLEKTPRDRGAPGWAVPEPP